MRKKFTLLIAACALLLFLFPITGWGQTTNFTLSSADQVTQDGITVAFAKGSGSNAPAWYAAGLRLYASNTVTISCESSTTITGVTFNWEKQGSKAFASATANCGTYSHPSNTGQGIWNGTATEIVFTLGNSGQLQLNTFSVTYTTSGGGTQTETHTLTFSADPAAGGSVTVGTSTSGSIELEEDDEVSIVAAPAEVGYAFSNWTLNPATTGAALGNANNASTTFTMGEDDVELIAHFSTVTTYTVTYHANVTGTADIEETFNAGANVTVAANTFSNPGYAFTKWTTNENGTGTEYTPGDVINNIQANINLYAQWEESNDVTYNFAFATIGSTGWSNSYADHDFTYSDGTKACFYQSSKQTSTITDIPVTKVGPICIVMNNEEISGVTFVCRQWGTKAQTITLHYSTDGGESYTSTDVTSSNFTISSDNLPAGTNAVKITFSNSSNQIGVESATVTKVTSAVPTITFTPNPLSLGNVLVNQEIQETFTVAQSNLGAGISLEATFGTLSPNSINQGASATQVTWTYTPISAGAFNATVTATSGSLSETLSITGTAKESHTITVNSTTNGSVTASANSAIEGETINLTITPAANYQLDELTITNAATNEPVSVSNNSFVMPDANVTVSATFELIPEVVAEFVNGVYSETLLSQASFDTWKAYSVSGDQVWAFASGYGAKISGHVNSTNYANEDWFISPKMQVENGKLDIGFDCVGRYGDDGMITIYYSTDYTGIGDPNDANWTEITPDPAIPYDAGNWTYQTIACNIEQTGNVYFAFKYVSTDSQAGTFEVKNFTAKQYYTITLSATNGSITSDPENLAVVGATVELTATPNANYHFVSWSITPVVTIENDAFTMPAANVTVGAEFAQNATCTVTFVENGVTAYSDDDIPTGAIGNNLPDSPFNTVPANLDFLGWSLSPIDTYTETAPNLVGDTYNVEGDVTLYAVYKYDYSYTIGGGTPTWTKVTDASTLAAGDQLVIASDDDATSAVAGEIQTASSPYMAAVDAEFETSTMVTLPNDAIVLTLGGSSGSWTLTNNNRLLGSDGTKMKWNNGTTTWSISISNGDATIGVSETERFLYNVNSPRFKTYTSGTTASMVLPQLYRLEGGSTTVNGTYYLTSVTEQDANATISTATTWTGNNTVNAEFEIDGVTLTVGGLLINPDEDNIFIVNGGQLVTSSKGVKATLWKGIEQYTVPTTTSDENKSDGWYLIASPVVENTTPSASNGFLNGDATENTYDLYYYEEPTHYWMNYEVSPFDIQSKKGYLYANGENNGTILEFVGTVYPSNVNVTVGGLTYSAPSLAGFNLIGNPFTCTAYLTGGMSFYRMNAEKTALTAVNANMPINPMEGVFVEATAATQSATFTTTAPSSNSNVRKLNIKVSGRERVLDNAIVSFSENGSLSKFMLNPEQTCLYIPQDGSDYAIVSCDNEGETPVCFKAEENGNYILSVNIENVEMNYLHLIDNMTGADVDLLATPSYSFEARTTDYASRFRLVFSANNGSNENGNETFAYYNGSEWVISNMGEATLQVVDVMGRVLSSETVSGNANVSLNQTPGVYMLRLVNSDSVKTQKIVVR